MKNNNKKGVILLEAAIGITVLLICLYFLASIIGITSSQHERSLDVVASQNIKKVTNQIDYLKRALMERGQATEYAKQNLIYAGWDTIEATPQGETINELSGEYILQTGCTGVGVQGLCLRKSTGDDDWGYLKIGAFSQRYKDSGDDSIEDGNRINTGTNQNDECEELSEDCQAYKIIIENANDEKYEPIFYTESTGVVREVAPAKTLSVIIKNADLEVDEQQIEKFNYLLTIY